METYWHGTNMEPLTPSHTDSNTQVFGALFLLDRSFPGREIKRGCKMCSEIYTRQVLVGGKYGVGGS